MLCRALEATGLREFRIGLGDAALFPRLLDQAGVDGAARERVMHELATGDFVGMERELSVLRIDDAHAEPAAARRAPARRPRGPRGDRRRDRRRGRRPAAPLRAASRPRWRGGSSSTWGSRATSATTRARSSRCYDPGLGTPLGGGGRYDDLLGRFGRSLPAVGFALRIDDLHQALTARQRPCLS